MSLKQAMIIVGGLMAAVLGFPSMMLFLMAGGSASLPLPTSTLAVGSLPAAVVAADVNASDRVGSIVAGCVVPSWVLMGIGEVESHNAAGHSIAANGDVSPPILGPALDGSIPGTARIPATDGGALDGDPVWDHAVGPMQILPSTWLRWAQDAVGDGAPDPENFPDAALTAAVILCQRPAGSRDLTDPANLSAAIFSYNHSQSYVNEVESWASYFESLSQAGPSPASPGASS